MYSAQQHVGFSAGAAAGGGGGGISNFTLSTAVDADQEESAGEEPSLEDVTGGGRGRDVGDSERTWSVATDILHWLCVCVFVCLC